MFIDIWLLIIGLAGFFGLGLTVVMSYLDDEERNLTRSGLFVYSTLGVLLIMLLSPLIVVSILFTLLKYLFSKEVKEDKEQIEEEYEIEDE